MHLLRIIYLSLESILLTFILTGCIFSTKLDYLSGTETCSPPCWMNIYPGITSVKEAIKTLEDFELHKKGKLTLLDYNVLKWRTSNGDNVYFETDDNKVIAKIKLDLRSKSISMNDIITHFGEPSSIDIGSSRNGSVPVTIFYPDKGIAFVFNGSKVYHDEIGRKIKIEANMNAVFAYYLKSTEFTDMVNSLYGINVAPETLLNIQPWKGYGTYEK